MDELIAVVDEGAILAEAKADGVIPLALFALQNWKNIDAIVGAFGEWEGSNGRNCGKVIATDTWDFDVTGLQRPGPFDERGDT